MYSFLRTIFPETSRSEAPRCVGPGLSNFRDRNAKRKLETLGVEKGIHTVKGEAQNIKPTTHVWMGNERAGLTNLTP